MNETTRGGFKIAGIGAGIVAAFAAAIIGGQALASTGGPTEPTPTPTYVVSVYELNGFAAGPPKATPTPATATEAAPIVAAPEEAPEEPYYGTPLPWVAQEGNAEGGYWDTTQCPSSSGYTAPDGNQYCAP